MDKYEFNIKADRIKKLAKVGEYETAMKICDGIDWRRVSSVSLLSLVSEVYEKNQEYSEAKEILLLAYERAPIGKRLLYRLTVLALKDNNIQEAEVYCKEFYDLAPDDPRQFILRYLILKEKNAPVDQLIHTLEEYNRRELDERWMYELAELYHKAGKSDECVAACDKIMLMFGIGQYVDKAITLKTVKEGKPLTEYQQGLVDNRDQYEEKLKAVETAYGKYSDTEVEYNTEDISGIIAQLPEGAGAELSEDAEGAIAEEENDEDAMILAHIRALEEDPEFDVEAEDGGRAIVDLSVLDETVGVLPALAGMDEYDPVPEEEEALPEAESEEEMGQTKVLTSIREFLGIKKNAPEEAEDEEEAEEPAQVPESAPAAPAHPAAPAQPAAPAAPAVKAEEPAAPVQEAAALEAPSEPIPTVNFMIERKTPEAGIEQAKTFLKLMHEHTGSTNGAAKIKAAALNEKGVFESRPKLVGKDLIVEEAGDLSDRSVVEILTMIDEEPGDRIVVLIDNPRQMEKLRSRFPELMDVCHLDSEEEEEAPAPAPARELPVITLEPSAEEEAPAAAEEAVPEEEEDLDSEELDIDAFANYAIQYAESIDCAIPGKSRLALYERIEIMEEDGIRLTKGAAVDLIEEAADRAENPSFGKKISGLFSSKYTKEGLLILKEDDFIY